MIRVRQEKPQGLSVHILALTKTKTEDKEENKQNKGHNSNK